MTLDDLTDVCES